MLPKNTSRVARKLLNISSHAREGWEVSERPPSIGAEVLSVEGPAKVVRVLGKVPDGSRLLELQIVGRDGPSFFAATSNVLQEEDPGCLRGDAHLSASLDASLSRRIDALCEEGREFWHEFDARVRQEQWHPFVAADYDLMRAVLLSVRRPRLRFLEWGSASGVITIMADLMGFDACGIEIDASLVRSARRLAERSGSKARFAVGSFIPMGWRWNTPDGDGRTATIGDGPSGYLELGHPLEDFDVVYAYPWSGEEPLMQDLMRCHGHTEALLILHGAESGVSVYRHGTEVGAETMAGHSARRAV
jgi:hypothetical protein